MLPSLYKPEKLAGKSFAIEAKWDGNRAEWNGIKGILHSKSGVQVVPPASWTQFMPRNCHLDGELWIRHSDKNEYIGSLDELNGVWTSRQKITNQSKLSDERWKAIRFRAFDIRSGGPKGIDTWSWTQRSYFLQYMLWMFAQTQPHKTLGPVLKYIHTEAILRWNPTMTRAERMKPLEDLIRKYQYSGAEGLILKDITKPYLPVKAASAHWLKLKFVEDSECLVVSKSPGSLLGERPQILVRHPLPNIQREEWIQFAEKNLMKEVQVNDVVTIRHMAQLTERNQHFRSAVLRAIVQTRWSDIMSQAELNLSEEAQQMKQLTDMRAAKDELHRMTTGR
jgi:hypothetical protein